MDDNEPHTPLLARLDALREYLRKRRRYHDVHGHLSTTEIAEIDAHLATLDDACEALQS